MNDVTTAQAIQKRFSGYPILQLWWLVEVCDDREETHAESQAIIASLARQDARASKLIADAWPSLERLVAYGLSQPMLRDRILLSADALFVSRGRRAPSDEILLSLSALLSAPEVALNVARQLWRSARVGDVSCVEGALVEATRSAVESVPFFASLALSHQAHRRKAKPPTILAAGAPSIGDVYYEGSSMQIHCSYALDKDQPLNVKTEEFGACFACGDPRARLVHTDGYGSNAGGSHFYSYHCSRCGLYTHSQKDWG